VLDAANGAMLAKLLDHSPLSVALSPDGRLLATGHAPHDITLWDWKEKRLLKKLEAHSNWVVALAFSPDGRLLVSGAGDSTARVWEVATGKGLGLHLPQKIDAAHGLWTMGLSRVPQVHDAHHVVEARVAFPQALKPRRTIALTI
jgi:WD40 repeat protein